MPRIHQTENFLEKKKKVKLEIQSKEYTIREKAKRREKKWESLPWDREDAKKLCFPWLHKNIIFIGDALSEREIVFQFFFFGKQPKKNKLYFY